MSTEASEHSASSSDQAGDQRMFTFEDEGNVSKIKYSERNYRYCYKGKEAAKECVPSTSKTPQIYSYWREQDCQDDNDIFQEFVTERVHLGTRELCSHGNGQNYVENRKTFQEIDGEYLQPSSSKSCSYWDEKDHNDNRYSRAVSSNTRKEQSDKNQSNIRKEARRKSTVDPIVDRIDTSNSSAKNNESLPSSTSDSVDSSSGSPDAHPEKTSSDTTNSSSSGSSGGESTDKSSGSSSGSGSSSSSNKGKKKKIKKRRGFWDKILKSAPEENRLLKLVLWFPIGVALSLGLHFMVIQKMNLENKTKALIGAAIGFLLSLTFALSVQMRCVMCLVIPTFVGKAGRSYIAAFALIYLINGPITNIMDNAKEIVRSLTCTSALLSNHTKEKWKLRLHPVENALGDLQTDGFLINRVAKKIEKTFLPLKREVMKNSAESKSLEKEITKVEKVSGSEEKIVEKLEREHKNDEDIEDPGKKVEKEWEKKLDLRCQGTFSKGEEKCQELMGKLEDKCMDALWILGHLMCWPLKITVFCKIVTLLPGAVGMSCSSMNVVNPGFGDTFVSAKAVIDDMDDGMKVKMQYKVVGSTESVDYTPVEEMRQATIHEVSSKTSVINFLLKSVAHILTFTFLIIFKGAYNYNSKYLTDFSFDNKYLTSYFRHIDSRRKAQGKKTLLPLKKYERKDVVDPKQIKLSVAEKGKLTSGTGKLILRIIVSAIVCYMDSLLYQVLDIIARNSRVEYHQTGEHIIDIRVSGKGFMSSLVQSFLQKFNSKHKLNQITTNYACLPRPTQTDEVITGFIFATYIMVWLFMYFESFGLRLRYMIAAFFYRKREKKRILYLYNEMYRKRSGYLRHMRHKVRKQLRKRELKKKVGLLMALQRTFPRLCKCLRVCQSSKDTCIICGEPETKDFHRCVTEGCGVGYCSQCWTDVRKKCYACGEDSDADSDISEESELSDDDSQSEVE